MTTSNSYLVAVWGSKGIVLWDIYIKGVWVGSRRTYTQAWRESHDHKA